MGSPCPAPKPRRNWCVTPAPTRGLLRRKCRFVQAHGTGTAVGDPIEATALSDALCGDRKAGSPLPIGSVKTNLGHLETAAGVVGLIKGLLVLKHGQIPGSLHFTAPNEHIDLAALKLRVPTKLEPLPRTDDGPRIVGVNSFGFGGANAHVILAEAPVRTPAVAHGTCQVNVPGRWSSRHGPRPRCKAWRGVERVGGGSRQEQWHRASAAGAGLYSRRAPQSSRASVHHCREDYR